MESKLTPLSERLVNAGMMAKLVHLANDHSNNAPATVVFLGAARLAAQRGRFRLAMSELGTGLEALLTQLLSLPTDHKQTLSPLIDSAAAAHISLPTDIKQALVQPRNRAVHKGIEPDASSVIRAIQIVDDLVRTYLPDFSCPQDLERGHRPSRVDLQIVQPPGHKGLQR
jgi:hypothetical protein